jgi:hypothetical protein
MLNETEMMKEMYMGRVEKEIAEGRWRQRDKAIKYSYSYANTLYWRTDAACDKRQCRPKSLRFQIIFKRISSARQY